MPYMDTMGLLYTFLLHVYINVSVGIQSPKLRMVVEPKYYKYYNTRPKSENMTIDAENDGGSFQPFNRCWESLTLKFNP